jgi:hypothetical protein
MNIIFIFKKLARANFMLIITLYVLMCQDILKMEENITFFLIKIKIFFED